MDKFILNLTFISEDKEYLYSYEVLSSKEKLDRVLPKAIETEGILSFELQNGGKFFLNTNCLVLASYIPQ